MKLNKNRFSKFIGLIIGIGLSFFTIHSISAQDFNEDYTGQVPVEVKVISQPDCPFQIKVLNVDNSNSRFQLVNYTLQNVSDKSIRAYVIAGGKTVTSMTTTKFFEPYQVETQQWDEERFNIKLNPTISLSVDYVYFTDGSSWGEDKLQMSKHIKQFYSGMKTALNDLTKALQGGRMDLMKILDQDSLNIEVPIPQANMDDKSSRGFQTGYKGAIRILQKEKNQDDNFILKKIEELKTALEDLK